MKTHKVCIECKQNLEIEGNFSTFWRSERQSYGVTARCKPCHRARRYPNAAAGLRQCIDCEKSFPIEDFPYANGAKGREGYRKRRCQACWLAFKNGKYVRLDRAWRYKSAYKITLEDRDAMLAAQGGCCAICKRTEPNAADWATDHDHACCPTRGRSCGKCIRGILCHSCNSALGLLGDDPEALRNALAYLDQAAVSRRLPA